MRRLILAAAFVLCVLPAHATTITVGSWDPGGDIETYELWWKRIAAAGINVRVNGACVSACSIVLGIVPSSRICVTPRGKFGLHMASYFDGEEHPSKRLTRQFVRSYYPKWLQRWLKTQPPLRPELTWLTPKTLRAIGSPIRQCST